MLATLAAGLLLAAAPVAGADIDRFIESEMEALRIPGLSLAIAKDGEVMLARGYGFANVEHEVRATPQTVYQSGSLGKQFTATAVMMLVEEGRLALDDPLSSQLPGTPAHWKDVRIRHLLTHTSGIRDYDLPLQHEYTDGDLLHAFAAPPLDFPPGTVFRYSNTGYSLLGFVIERVSGRFYGELLAERVFRPLGMESARIISERDIVRHRAAGYRLVDGALQNQEWVSPSLNRLADGSLYLTALDLARWDAALYGETLLKRPSLALMWTPARLANGQVAEGVDDDAYGLGWAIGEQRGHRRIQHGGAWQGFSTAIARYVDDRLSVIVLCNLADVDATALAQAVAGLVEPALAPPALLPTAPDPDPARTGRVRAKLLADEHEAPRLAGETQLEFLACDEVAGRGYERSGRPLERICSYRLSPARRHYKVWLGAGDDVVGFFGEGGD